MLESFADESALGRCNILRCRSILLLCRDAIERKHVSVCAVRTGKRDGHVVVTAEGQNVVSLLSQKLVKEGTGVLLVSCCSFAGAVAQGEHDGGVHTYTCGYESMRKCAYSGQQEGQVG